MTGRRPRVRSRDDDGGRLTEQRIHELAARFKVAYFVPARAGDFNFPIVFQEGGWTVYEVK